MRTGKIGLNDYLHGIRRAPSPLCECEEGRQTVRDVLINCRRYSALRRECWSHPSSDWTVPTLRRGPIYLGSPETSQNRCHLHASHRASRTVHQSCRRRPRADAEQSTDEES
ncbi:hypothetical protein BX600DRAFT_167241 [Xylariales sp. PMI_506]|nr:hypothetical protein BX600DRAFT_167241 [Xylariales sp. PMI_506]